MQAPELTLRIIVADSSDNNGLPGEVTATRNLYDYRSLLIFADASCFPAIAEAMQHGYNNVCHC